MKSIMKIDVFNALRKRLKITSAVEQVVPEYKHFIVSPDVYTEVFYSIPSAAKYYSYYSIIVQTISICSML